MLVVRSVVVGPFAANCYLVACDRTGEALLLDPGGEIPRALALRDPEGFSIVRIYSTHGHIDHVAGAAEARRLTGAPFEIHPDDQGWVEALPKQAEMFGFEPVDAPEVDLRAEDGEAIRVGEHTAKVLHTPGHSAGSTCLWFPDAKEVFTGDTLFSGSVGRTDLPGGDFDALARSIREKLFALGDEVRFHPGHGPGGTIGEERRSNPFVGEAPRRGRFV